MTDIALQITNNSIDWQTDGFNGIAYASDEIETAVYLSLFTNLDWWGNGYGLYALGSKLYTLSNSVVTSQAVLCQTALGYCNSALQWLVTTNKIQSFNVNVTSPNSSALIIQVSVIEYKNPVPVTYSYVFPIN